MTKRQLITLSTVFTALTLSLSVEQNSARAQLSNQTADQSITQSAQGLPSTTPTPPGKPVRLPDYPDHHEPLNKPIDVPEDLHKHREHFEEVKGKGKAKNEKTDSEESAQEANERARSQDEAALLKDEKVNKKWRKFISQGDEAVSNGKFSAATSKFKRALSYTKKSDISERLKAITYKRLGLGYTGRKKYMEARDFLRQAKELYNKLGIEDSGLKQAAMDLSKWYKELDFHKFGNKVAKYFEEAHVKRISVFKDSQDPKIEVELSEKLIRPLKSEKVQKVKFAKTVSFNFKALPNSNYGLGDVTGLQVKTKKLWVNLLDSILGRNNNNEPEAQVTGGKLGKEKTVKVKVPDKLYNQSMSILEELKKAIDSTKYDADILATPTEADEDDHDKKDKGKLPHEAKKGAHPPDVIHSIDEPVEPHKVNPEPSYHPEIDNHLNQDKPQTRYP